MPKVRLQHLQEGELRAARLPKNAPPLTLPPACRFLSSPANPRRRAPRQTGMRSDRKGSGSLVPSATVTRDDLKPRGHEHSFSLNQSLNLDC